MGNLCRRGGEGKVIEERMQKGETDLDNEAEEWERAFICHARDYEEWWRTGVGLKAYERSKGALEQTSR